jgi:hypothetical protein
MVIMLGLVDLLRAMKGTATTVLRRVPPKLGLGAVAVLWVGAVGAVFAYVHEEPASGSPGTEDAAHAAQRDGTGGQPSTSDGDRDGDGYDDATGTPSWTVVDPSSSTTTGPDGATEAVPGDDLGGPTGTAPGTPPSSGSPDPSWTPGSSTTAPPTSGATTTTTTPTTTAPPSSGGLLGGLIDLLGGKG